MRKKSKVKGQRSKLGFSLVEMLVVLFVFSIVGILVMRSVGLSLKGTGKSENIAFVKENVEFAQSTMERLLRNARSLTCPLCGGGGGGPCSRLDYTDEYGNPAYFECITEPDDTYIASNSATVRLTSPQIQITNCDTIFSSSSCGTDAPPHSVDISITAQRRGITGSEGAQVTSRTKILLRNYGL